MPVPKVGWPLGGRLCLAFHLSIPEPAFEAQLRLPLPESPPFLNPEALKPALTGRLSLGLRCGRQGPPVYVCWRGTGVQLSNCTEQIVAARQGLQWEGSSWGSRTYPHLPQRLSQFSASPLERGEGTSLAYIQSQGVAWGVGAPRPHLLPSRALPAPTQVP